MTQPSDTRIAELVDLERRLYVERNARSQELHDSREHLVGQVPMTWMAKWSGGFPITFERARGNRIFDVDGHELIDFALGDTGAMAGHSPAPTVAAVERRIAELGGITTMLPSDDAEAVAAELSKRFGMARWSFSLSATDANRWALRLARLLTGRPKILVFSYCYHGSVDETFVVLGPDGRAMVRPGNVAPAVDPTTTTRVVEFNDIDAVVAALSHGDVACVLAEPALTNIGIVLPEPGFHEALRQATRDAGALLMIDETHTISASAGGATRTMGLEPDVVTLGKSIGGGVPCGAYGLAGHLLEPLARVLSETGADVIDVGGVGGTLAGNALASAAMRATLTEVLTDDAFSSMIELATRYVAGVEAVLSATGLPWSIVQLGARAEYRFTSPAPLNGGASAAAHREDLDELVHLYLANRGVLLTPFHNMALMCPATTAADVDRHTELFAELAELLVA